MILTILAAAGSALVLTQSSLTAPVRSLLDRHVASYERSVFAPAFERRSKLYLLLMRIAAKLLACPMCAGFWLGLVWSAALGARGVELMALGFAGSLASAILVALWLALAETHASLGLWRYLSTPPEGVHAARWHLAKQMKVAPLAILCPEPDCEATGGQRCERNAGQRS